MAEQEIIPAGKPIGRPLTYSQAIADEICERLASDQSLASICRSEHMPALTTVYRWKRDNEVFRADYARAREDQGHTAADQITDIRAQVGRGEIAPDVARVMIQSIQWESGKRAGREFGDKIQVESQNRTLAMGIPADATAEAAALAYEKLVKGE